MNCQNLISLKNILIYCLLKTLPSMLSIKFNMLMLGWMDILFIDAQP